MTWQDYLASNQSRFVDELLDFVRIPSVSASADCLRRGVSGAFTRPPVISRSIGASEGCKKRKPNCSRRAGTAR